jgi:hypothetical protein
LEFQAALQFFAGDARAQRMGTVVALDFIDGFLPER